MQHVIVEEWPHAVSASDAVVSLAVLPRAGRRAGAQRRPTDACQAARGGLSHGVVV